MGKRCIATGCSNTNSDGVSLFRFPRDPSLRKKWNKQVQRTRADWKDATEYSVLCSDHFTSDSFEMDSFLAARFGMAKKKRLKPDAIYQRYSIGQLLLQTLATYKKELL